MATKQNKTTVTAKTPKVEEVKPLSQTELDSIESGDLFHACNRIVADCKGRDHVKAFTETDAKGKTQTRRASSGKLVLSKDASDSVKKRQEAVSALETLLDCMVSLKLPVPCHLRKLVKGLYSKQMETITKLVIEAEVTASMK